MDTRDLMRQSTSPMRSTRGVRIPVVDKLSRTSREIRGTDRLILWILGGVFVLSAMVLIARANSRIMVEVPTQGGALNEGIVGTPRFINPLLAISDADRDLTMLMFSGLLRVSSDGTLIPDLAERYDVSEDGLQYTFVLREDATFHDGEPVTADDILFTVAKAVDPAVKSPQRASWEGVTVEKVSDREVVFTLKQPYAPFLDNATLGILPKHLWEGVPSDAFPFSSLNEEPVGSGPYKLRSIDRTSSGIPRSYTLSANRDFVLGGPYLSSITLTFFEREEDALRALNRGTIDSLSGIAPEEILALEAQDSAVLRYPLPRIFAVFFNQNQAPIFSHKEVREALSMSAPREEIVTNVLYGYGSAINSPLPPSVAEVEDNSLAGEVAAARAHLEKAGWKFNEEKKLYEKKTKTSTEELTFSISTASAPELRATAEILKGAWEAMGASVSLKVFETGDLNQNVIRPRRYDALLFGEVVGREPDLYAFWHSSQRNDPGLNVALYVNNTADKLLEKARATITAEERNQTYQEFLLEIEKDTPAVFLYAPDFVYIVPKGINGIDVSLISTPAERFANIQGWHTATERVWGIFAE